MVKIPRALNATYLKVNKVRKANPGIEVCQVAEILGITPEKVSEIDTAFQSVHSLDYVHNEDEREEW